MRKIILLFIAFFFLSSLSLNISEEFVQAKKTKQSFAEPLWFLHTLAEFGPQI